mgnify:CR=1 FL=1
MRLVHSIVLGVSLLIAAAATQAMASPGAGAHPFELSSTGHIVVPAEINRRAVYLVVDTGAAASVIDAAAAESLGMTLAAGADAVATGAGGAGLRLQTSHGNQFRFAGTETSDFTFRIMDLGHVVRALAADGRPIIGVVGVDWLERHGATISYSERTISTTR